MRNRSSLSMLSALYVALFSLTSQAQLALQTAPQTARQALMEMFFSKTPGTLLKHLPDATLSVLEKSGGLKTLQQYSALAGQLHPSGSQLETFEAGQILLSAADPKTGHRVEMIVEQDSLRGEEDDIELSFRTYKDKQIQRTPFMPRITFAMKLEAGVWKVNEIRIAVRVPLADPDFLKAITDGIKAQAASLAVPHSAIASSTTTLGPDSSTVAAMRTIISAETIYSNTYTAVGYTCTLSDLDGFGGGDANEHQAMLIASDLAGGKRYGYVFALSGCVGTPARAFRLSATPAGNGLGRRALCSDQSGTIRYAADGNSSTCLAAGLPVQ